MQHFPFVICIYIRTANKAENYEREENSMRKMFVITMCATMLCMAAGDAKTVCGAVNTLQTSAVNLPLVTSPNSDKDISGYIPGMENPFKDCTTLKEAGSIAGFSMEAPKEINGYGKQNISAVRNSLIQIIYGSGKKALYVRKAVGDSDISGDYNKYTEQDVVKVKVCQVTLRGTKSKVNTAVWTNGDYSYSVYTQSAINRKQMKKIVKNVMNADIPNKEINDNAQRPSPIIDYTTMDEAAKAAGFTLNAPETIMDYKRELISVISNDTIQLMYEDGEKSLYIRKASGSGDISGDYNKYDENKTVKIGEIQVDMRSMAGKVSTAVWTAEGFAYSVYVSSSITQDMMTDIICSVMQ